MVEWETQIKKSNRDIWQETERSGKISMGRTGKVVVNINPLFSGYKNKHFGSVS